MVGVWEPSTLAQADPASTPDTSSAALSRPTPAANTPAASAPEASGSEVSGAEASAPEANGADTRSDSLPEGDDYFSVRGELIYTRPETGDLVIKVRQQPRADGSRPVPFKLQLKGEIPLQHLRHFVSLDLRRQGQQLTLEALEVLEPVAQRGNRGGKGGGKGGGQGRRSAPGAEKGGAAGGGRPRPPESGPSRPAAHGKAVSRPGR